MLFHEWKRLVMRVTSLSNTYFMNEKDLLRALRVFLNAISWMKKTWYARYESFWMLFNDRKRLASRVTSLSKWKYMIKKDLQRALRVLPNESSWSMKTCNASYESFLMLVQDRKRLSTRVTSLSECYLMIEKDLQRALRVFLNAI